MTGKSYNGKWISKVNDTSTCTMLNHAQIIMWKKCDHPWL